MTELPAGPGLDQYEVARLDVHEDIWRRLTSDAMKAVAEALRRHGVDPDMTWRVDYLALDAPALRIWQHARDPDTGQSFLTTKRDAVAQRPPFLVPLRVPVPGLTDQPKRGQP